MRCKPPTGVETDRRIRNDQLLRATSLVTMARRASQGAGSSSEQLAGSKRGASAMDAGDGSTDLQEVGGGINGKAPRVEYERRYPARDIEPERQEGATGPDRPKRKRVDGMACYANSGEGMKRRCDATGRPPGRPPG